MWLKQHKFIFSHFGSWKSKNKRPTGLVSPEVSHLVLQMATSLLPPHTASGLSPGQLSCPLCVHALGVSLDLLISSFNKDSQIGLGVILTSLPV